MSTISTTTYDTTPQAEDPLDSAGTLIEQAKRKTKLEIYGRKINEEQTDTARRLLRTRIQHNTISMSHVLADVVGFTKLIDDRVINFNQLEAEVNKAADAFYIRCLNPPPPEVSCSRDLAEETRYLLMSPTQSFFQSVTRYANEKTPLAGLTGTFLFSEFCNFNNHTERPVVWKLLSDLLNFIFMQLFNVYGTNDELGNWTSKSILLRTLRPDCAGRWPKFRSCRAILHKDYRDDISHLWLMRKIAELIPAGQIERYFFDGNLLFGAILIPEVARIEHDSEYGGGLFFFSGEVGNRRCGIMPFVYRAINRAIVIMGDNWSVTHYRNTDLGKISSSIRDYIHEQIPLVVTHLDKLLEAQKIVFSEKDPLAVERLIIALSNSFRVLSQQDLRLWRIGVLAEKSMIPGLAFSAFTLQNGMSRMSQVLDDPIKRMQLDQLAGDLLKVDWDKIIKRAVTIQDEQVRKIFPN